MPKVVVGGKGSGNQAGLTGQEIIMDLLAIERLDRFVDSPSAELETRQ